MHLRHPHWEQTFSWSCAWSIATATALELCMELCWGLLAWQAWSRKVCLFVFFEGGVICEASDKRRLNMWQSALCGVMTWRSVFFFFSFLCLMARNQRSRCTLPPTVSVTFHVWKLAVSVCPQIGTQHETGRLQTFLFILFNSSE